MKKKNTNKAKTPKKNKDYESRIHGFVEPLDWSSTAEESRKSPNVAKGFKMYFSNGNSISIQFGKGNYCELKDSNKSFGKTTNVIDCEMWGPITHSESVEIAIFDPFGEFIDLTPLSSKKDSASIIQL